VSALSRLLQTITLTMLAISPTLVLAVDLPLRMSPIPQTTYNVPHLQIGIEAVPHLSERLLDRVGQFPGVSIGPTRVSMPGGIGFQFDDGVELARPDVIVGGREFAHLHADGSLHVSLDPDVAVAAIESGWAVSHPWADQREGWKGFVMVFTPQTDEDLEVVIQLVESSYSFVT